VAIGATEGDVDFVVANEAILHVRKANGEWIVRRAVAGLAFVLRRIEMGAELGQVDPVGRGQIGFGFNGRTDGLGKVAHFQVLRVVKILEHLAAPFFAEGGGFPLDGVASPAIERLLKDGLVVELGEEERCGQQKNAANQPL
jgi:hypothetical protein